MDPPGSKPIIQQVGGSTTQVEVPVIETTLTLDITPDDFAVQREAMTEALAVQYGVNTSQITLAANLRRRLSERGRRLATMQISVTISVPLTPLASPGSAPVTTAADLLATVSAVTPATLGASLGTVVGQPVTVVVTAAPVTSTIRQTVTFEWWAGGYQTHK